MSHNMSKQKKNKKQPKSRSTSTVAEAASPSSLPSPPPSRRGGEDRLLPGEGDDGHGDEEAEVDVVVVTRGRSARRRQQEAKEEQKEEEEAVNEAAVADADASVAASKDDGSTSNEDAGSHKEEGDDDSEDSDAEDSEADDEGPFIIEGPESAAATTLKRKGARQRRGEGKGGEGEVEGRGQEAATTTGAAPNPNDRMMMTMGPLRSAVHAGPFLSSRRPSSHDPWSTSKSTSAVAPPSHARLEAWTVLPHVVTDEYVILPQPSLRLPTRQQRGQQDGDHVDDQGSGGGSRFVLSVLSSRTSQHVATLVPPSPPTVLLHDDGGVEEAIPATTDQGDREDDEVNDGGTAEEATRSAREEHDDDDSDQDNGKDVEPTSRRRRGQNPLDVGQLVSAQAVQIGSTPLLYVGTDTGVVCEYGLDDTSLMNDDVGRQQSRRSATTGLGIGTDGIPPRQTFQLCWPSIPPELLTSSNNKKKNRRHKNEDYDGTNKDKSVEGGHGDTDDNVEKSDVEMEDVTSDKDEVVHDDGGGGASKPSSPDATAVDGTPIRKRKPPPMPSSEGNQVVPEQSSGLQLHHLTFASIRSNITTTSPSSVDDIIVGYGLASPVLVVDDDKEDELESAAPSDAMQATHASKKKEKGAPKPRHQPPMMLIRFLVPFLSTSSSTANVVTSVPVTILDRWDVDKDPASFKSPSSPPLMSSHVHFQLLSTVVPSTSQPGTSAIVVMVASTSGLALYCDESQSIQERHKKSSSGQSARMSTPPSLVIQHPKRASNLLTAVAVPGGRFSTSSSSNQQPVAMAHWSGEIRVWPTLLQDVMTYLSQNNSKSGLQGPAKKKKKLHSSVPDGHPMKTSPSVRLHWHAHPVSSIVFHPDDPSILYSGGEESVLCVWEWKRSVAVSSVLPRLSTGPIVHVAASTVPRLIVHTSDNVLHCIVPHNLAIAWKKIGIAAEPKHNAKLLKASEADNARQVARPIVLVDRQSQFLMLLGLPRSPSALQEWDCDRRSLARSWPVAPHNRVSRLDWDDEEWAGPSVVCASFASPGTLLTVDSVPTENQSIGKDGLVLTLKFWERHHDRWYVSCAMSFPHGSVHDVSAVAVSPNGRVAVSVSNSEKAWQLWRRRATHKASPQDEDQGASNSKTVNLSEWHCECRVEMPMGLSNYDVGRDAVAFSPDSSVLAIAHGFLVSLWDPANLSLLGTLRHTSQDRSVSHRRSLKALADPLPVHTLQFTSHHDMLLTASNEMVALQRPDGGSWGRITDSDGWSHRPPLGHVVTCVTADAVRNRTQSVVAIASYCSASDASTIEVLDLVSGQVLWIDAGNWSSRIVSLTSTSLPPSGSRPALHESSKEDAPIAKISVWDQIPSYTPLNVTGLDASATASAIAEAKEDSMQKFPKPYRLPPVPLQLWVLTSRGQLVSVVEDVKSDEYDGGATSPGGGVHKDGVDRSTIPNSSETDPAVTLQVPKIALFESLQARTAATASASSTASTAAPVMMDWRDLLLVAPSSEGNDDDDEERRPRGGGIVAVPSSRLGSSFVRSFVSSSSLR